VSPSGVGSRAAAGWALAAGAVALTVVALVVIGRGVGDRPLDPTSDARLGTSAMVALADDLGADVRIDDRFPDLDAADAPDVVVLFSDRLDTSQRTQLDGWIDDGGRLVVTDPGSEYTPPLSGDFLTVDDLDPAARLRDDCQISAFDDIDVSGVDPRNGGVLYDAGSGDDVCITDGLRSAYVVATDQGDGTVVSVGGSGMFVNAALAEGENAAVVAALVAPTADTRLVVLAPEALAGGGSGSRTLGDLVPTGVTRGLVQLCIAFLVYAVWRSRRLGRPVPEPQPSAIAGSELVAATGTLLDRTRSPGHAADLLRNDLRHFLADHLGVPPTATPAVLAQVASERTPADHDALLWALTAPVTDDDGLVALASTIDRIRLEVLAHV